ncbi:MAG: putative porin, partial [Nitrospira sp.]|nr:putative porin [Nitrospira sp.]
MGDYVKNMANPITTSGTDSGDTGYQLGLILGKASDPGTWELAYFYKVVETDATLADVSDSDFGDGGIDRRGHIIWGAYNLTKYLQFKTKFYNTKKESETDNPTTKDDIDRLQVDLSVKF